MEIETSSDLMVRRGTLGALMTGIALAALLQGRQPGPLPYYLSGAVALIFVFSSFTSWRRTGWIGVLAYIVLVSALMTSSNGVLGMLTGLGLAILTAFQSFGDDEGDEESEEADASLDRFQSGAQ